MAAAPSAASEAAIAGLQSHARAQFPYFQPGMGHPAFMENAGGSQVPASVINAMCSYMTHSYAQLGAGHAVSNRADATVAAARHFMNTLMNGHGVGRVALGPSTSRLVDSLAYCYSTVLGPQDEVLVQESGHESNIGPWVRMAATRGCTLRTWKLDARELRCPVRDLPQLLTPHTRIVALSHVSNLLGEVMDLQAVVQLVRQHAPAARIVVDGVAYAPHRAIDVACWGVDYYVISNYKCWGPHMASMFVSDAAADELVAAGGTRQGPNHYFVPQGDLVYSLELGGVPHEGCAGLLGLQEYLATLAAAGGEEHPSIGHQQPQQQGAGGASSLRGGGEVAALTSHLSRQQVEAAYAAMAAMEAAPQQLLIGFLQSQQGVRIIGPEGGPGAAEPASRLPTVSFVHDRLLPSHIAGEVNACGYAIRNGHMYARRLVEALVAGSVIAARGCDTDAAVNEGVVRVSLLHYNTREEVEGLTGVLRRVLA